ncbi:hypothetical protein ABZ682_22900 [Streptomyces griseoviridis]|uniref:hypothetical protein n=1 Tax=Streptomyces griseoviridis TaxID=45398 RepID=UPI0033F9F024
MTKTAPSSPTVAIARILRGLGLTQGRGGDFRVTGEYRNGERVGTYVLLLGRRADETVAEHADDIERLAGETGFAFRVSVRYFDGKPRPVCSVANYGSRVRDTPPAPQEAPAELDAPAVCERPAWESEPSAAPDVDEPTPAAELPPAGTTAARFLDGARERARNRGRAKALDWSYRQAYLVATAAAGGLVYDRHGFLRDCLWPGVPGAQVDEARLGPLVKAGFLTVTQPFGTGYTRVSITVDGRDALTLWRVYRPTPAVKDRKQEREQLQPLVGGEETARRTAACIEDDRLRRVESDAFYEAMGELHAWEDREERRAEAWAKVQGFTYRLGRKPPPGWVPTAEEIAAHILDPAVVDDLRAEAARPTEKPALPSTGRVRLIELPPLPAAPDQAEQLGLFAEAA